MDKRQRRVIELAHGKAVGRGEEERDEEAQNVLNHKFSRRASCGKVQRTRRENEKLKNIIGSSLIP